VSSEKLEPNNDLSSAIEALLDAGRVDMAEQQALEMVRLARNSGEQLVHCLTAYGRVLTVKSRYKDALEIFFEALALCEQRETPPIEAEELALLYKATGVAFGNSGVLEEALRYYEMAAQTSPNKATQLICLSYIGILQGNLSSWAEARGILESIERDAGGFLLPAKLLWLRSIILYARLCELGKEASEERSKLLELQAAYVALQTELKMFDLKDLELDLSESLAEINMLLGTSETAEFYATHAVQLARDINNPHSMMVGLHLLAKIKKHFGNPNAALEHLLEALNLTQIMGNQGYVSHVHFELSQLYEQFGEFQKALHHHQEFHRIDAEKRSQTAITRANAMTARLQFERNALSTRLKIEHAESRAHLERERAEELAILNAKLEQLARTDVLTGVANRRALFELLEQMVEQVKRKHLILSVAMIDIDHFKQINDLFSHSVGDMVLFEVAKILKTQARAADVVARYGGEEFVLVLSGVQGRDALITCERIRQAIENHDWARVKPSLASHPITVSIGLCDVQTLENPEAWLNQADTALYRAKNAGRNQIRGVK
jgi:diguanylate cyclase (GGDEF)-like protein